MPGSPLHLDDVIPSDDRPRDARIPYGPRTGSDQILSEVVPAMIAVGTDEAVRENAASQISAKLLLDISGKGTFVRFARVGEEGLEGFAHDPVEDRRGGSTRAIGRSGRRHLELERSARDATRLDASHREDSLEAACPALHRSMARDTAPTESGAGSGDDRHERKRFARHPIADNHSERRRLSTVR
jgi:hypothetical protein